MDGDRTPCYKIQDERLISNTHHSFPSIFYFLVEKLIFEPLLLVLERQAKGTPHTPCDYLDPTIMPAKLGRHKRFFSAEEFEMSRASTNATPPNRYLFKEYVI